MSERKRGRLERLSSLDLSNLRIEDRGAPMHVAGLLILDRMPVTSVAGLSGLAVIRLHHVIADGVAALELLAVLLGPSPSNTAASPRPAPGSSCSQLAADQLAGAGRLLSQIVRPAAAWTRVRQIGGQAVALLGERHAPRLSLNAPLTSHRQFALVRADLELARDAAHAHGGTVNDVVLAAVAGGARALLAARGELGSAPALKASVAISLPRTSDQFAGGNRVGMMIAPLPAGEANACRCLARIAAATAQRKTRPPYLPGSRLLRAWLTRAMARQRLVNVFVSNLHGPTGVQSLAGGRVLELFQLGLVQGNVPVSIGALSYAGQLNVAVVADARIADLGVFVAGMVATLRGLGALSRPPALEMVVAVQSVKRES